jgi:two-component system response regulator RegA
MSDKPLLFIVEDDAAFARTLQRSFDRRGYEVVLATSPAELDALLEARTPDYAVVDLKLAQASGLTCVQTLRGIAPDAVIVVLTGYASIATAVQAIKLGATSYLAKPANTDDIERAFGMTDGDADVAITERHTSIKTASTCRKPRGGWGCTGGHWRGSWRSGRSRDGHAASARLAASSPAIALPSIGRLNR